MNNLRSSEDISCGGEAGGEAVMSKIGAVDAFRGAKPEVASA
jgi:hypothetical protein